MAEDPDPAYTYRNSQGTVRVIRGRGCNESFRAAVDRSYDAPLGLRNQMETRESTKKFFLHKNLNFFTYKIFVLINFQQYQRRKVCMVIANLKRIIF